MNRPKCESQLLLLYIYYYCQFPALVIEQQEKGWKTVGKTTFYYAIDISFPCLSVSASACTWDHSQCLT